MQLMHAIIVTLSFVWGGQGNDDCQGSRSVLTALPVSKSPVCLDGELKLESNAMCSLDLLWVMASVSKLNIDGVSQTANNDPSVSSRISAKVLAMNRNFLRDAAKCMISILLLVCRAEQIFPSDRIRISQRKRSNVFQKFS